MRAATVEWFLCRSKKSSKRRYYHQQQRQHKESLQKSSFEKELFLGLQLFVWWLSFPEDVHFALGRRMWPLGCTLPLSESKGEEREVLWTRRASVENCSRSLTDVWPCPGIREEGRECGLLLGVGHSDLPRSREYTVDAVVAHAS